MGTQWLLGLVLNWTYIFFQKYQRAKKQGAIKVLSTIDIQG